MKILKKITFLSFEISRRQISLAYPDFSKKISIYKGTQWQKITPVTLHSTIFKKKLFLPKQKPPPTPYVYATRTYVHLGQHTTVHTLRFKNKYLPEPPAPSHCLVCLGPYVRTPRHLPPLSHVSRRPFSTLSLIHISEPTRPY